MRSGMAKITFAADFTSCGGAVMAGCSVSWVGVAQFCQAAYLLHPLTVPQPVYFWYSISKDQAASQSSTGWRRGTRSAYSRPAESHSTLVPSR